VSRPPKELTDTRMETALVAAALIDPANFLAVEVQPHDFHDEQLAALWRCGRELVGAGQYVDGIILGDTLRAQGVPITEVRLAQLTALDVDCTHASPTRTGCATSPHGERPSSPCKKVCA
jgi:hypothetical protein